MIIGSKIYRTETCDNSLQWAKKHVDKAPDGALFLAKLLTHAHGRQGRTWQVDPGQIMATILLKPKNLHTVSPDKQSLMLINLNMALALGIQEPLKQYNIGLKWPNDFVVHDKKIGGMIMELVWHEDLLKGIILGFAINVNNTFVPSDSLYLSATSLAMITKNNINKEELLQQLLSSLDHWYNQWLNKKFDHIFEQWKKNQIYIGKNISVHSKDGKIASGIVEDISSNGDLILKVKNNKKEIIAFYMVEKVLIH